jgi:hypothetical protein
MGGFIMPRKGKFQDLIGKTFGKLTVLKLEGKDKYGKYRWICRCDCGNVKITDTSQLNSGYTQSCGCIRREQLVERNKSHGLAHTPLYNVWTSMKGRCNQPNNTAYKNYGGRGIAICEKWNSFEGFLEDMGDSYAKGFSIERLDVNGNYCKENCIWADAITQANNTRTNLYITVDGRTDTFANMCRIYGLTYATAQHRYQRGWEIEKVFKTPRLRKI